MDTTRKPPSAAIVPRADAVRAAQVQTRHPGVVTAGLGQLSQVQRSSVMCREEECRLRLLQVGKACMDAAWRDVPSQLETTPADGTAPRGFSGRKEKGRSEGAQVLLTTGQCVPASPPPLGSLICIASTALRMPWQRLKSTGPTAVASAAAAAEMAL